MRTRKNKKLTTQEENNVPDSVKLAFVVLRSYMENAGDGARLTAMEEDEDGNKFESPLKVVYTKRDEHEQGEQEQKQTERQALFVGAVPVYFSKENVVNIPVYRSTPTKKNGVFLTDLSAASNLFLGKNEGIDETKDGRAYRLLRRKGEGLNFAEYFEQVKRDGKQRASLFCSIESLRRALDNEVFTDVASDVVRQFFLTLDVVKNIADKTAKRQSKEV